MKEFEVTTEATAAFLREINMLFILAGHPHPHIVPHITSWQQKNKYYILYPKAKYSLREYMRSVKPIALGGKEVLWFLEQLRGLADAIKQVHELEREKYIGLSRDAKSKIKAEERDSSQGYHHDIKPENILVFERTLGYDPTFKLSDFGAGDIKKVLRGISESNFASVVRGTATYYGPEFEGKTSRPFDMWALGCVFLELMMWLFDGVDGERKFTSKRAQLSSPPGTIHFDTFWYKRRSEILLNPAVEEALVTLKNEHCAGMSAFEDIVAIIRSLLTTNPRERLRAKHLVVKLDAVYNQAKKDVAMNSNVYLHRRERNGQKGQTTLGTQPNTADRFAQSSGSSTTEPSFTSPDGQDQQGFGSTEATADEVPNELKQAGTGAEGATPSTTSDNDPDPVDMQPAPDQRAFRESLQINMSESELRMYRSLETPPQDQREE